MGSEKTKIAKSSREEPEHGFQSRPFESPRRSLPRPRAVSPKRTTSGNSSEDDEGAVEHNPRAFPYHVKQACWEKAQKIKGRDPDRWRRDAAGNIIFRKLVGCAGCLCHDYDHILPYSKGGESTIDNCQVLQVSANRAKGNRTDMSTVDLAQKSTYCRVSGRDMDFMEISTYGNVHHGQDSGGCRIQ